MASVDIQEPIPTQPKEIDAMPGLVSCNPRGGTPPKEIRVCVLNASYEGSESAMKDYDDLDVGPHHYINPELGDTNFKFTVHHIKKATAYNQVRTLCKSGKYDVFFNMCDACLEEDRAGVEVVNTLEECQVPFTGAKSKLYELTKPDQKMIAYYNGILTPRFAYVECRAEAERKCPGLRFPLLIKHPSGYSSVGMTKDCKVHNMTDLLARLDLFLAEYQRALIEEFIVGDEATALVCADDSMPDGVRVFSPVMIDFPEGEDFKHFDLKWIAFEGMEWRPVPKDHKAYSKLIDCASKGFKQMLGGFGYGRVDVRIDSLGDVYFLECNSMPGIMYPPGQEASSDWILKLEAGWDHRSFAILQMQQAFKYCESQKPVFTKDFDPTRGYHLRAAKAILKGSLVLHDEGRLQRLYTKPWVQKNWSQEQQQQFATSAWPVGRDHHVYAVWETDPASWFSYNHSCEPNMVFDTDRSFNIVACRDIDAGAELTMDYTTFMDKTCAEFDCHCGSTKCKKHIAFAEKPKGLLESPIDLGVNKPVFEGRCSPSQMSDENDSLERDEI